MDLLTNYTPQLDSPWPSWRKNIKNQGQSTYAGPLVPETIWKFTTTGRVASDTSQAFVEGITSTPVIGADGSVYFSANDGYLYCLHSAGSLKWKYALHFPGMAGLVVRNDNSVVVTSNYKLVYAISATGQRLWVTAVNSYIHSPPMVHIDGTVYVGSEGNDFNAIDGANGKIKWTRSLINQSISFISAPAIGEDTHIYVGAAQVIQTAGSSATQYYGYGYLLGLEPINGTIVYNRPLQNAVTSSPVISNGNILYVAYANSIDAIFLNNMTEYWSNQYGRTSNQFWSTMAIADDDNTLYVPSLDHTVYAVKGNGDLKWEYATDKYIDSSPTVDSVGNIYIHSDDGYLHAIHDEGTSASVIFKYNTGNSNPFTQDRGYTYFSSSPVISSNGVMYVGSTTGVLHAIASPAVTATITPTSFPTTTLPGTTINTNNSSSTTDSTGMAVGIVISVLAVVAMIIFIMKYHYNVVFFSNSKNTRREVHALSYNEMDENDSTFAFQRLSMNSNHATPRISNQQQTMNDREGSFFDSNKNLVSHHHGNNIVSNPSFEEF